MLQFVYRKKDSDKSETNYINRKKIISKKTNWYK